MYLYCYNGLLIHILCGTVIQVGPLAYVDFVQAYIHNYTYMHFRTENI